MPIITFQMITSEPHSPAFTIDVPVGTTVLDAAKACGLPLEHACEGYCACATCHVVILEGGGSLPPATLREEDMLDCAFDATPSSRLSCQARVGETSLHILIPKYSLNPAKMVKKFPKIWDPSLESTEINAKTGCQNCCCGHGKKPLGPTLDWDDAEDIALSLDAQDPLSDPALLRFTELHARICQLKNFGGDPEKSNEAKLERILQEWFVIRGQRL